MKNNIKTQAQTPVINDKLHPELHSLILTYIIGGDKKSNVTEDTITPLYNMHCDIVKTLCYSNSSIDATTKMALKLLHDLYTCLIEYAEMHYLYFLSRITINIENYQKERGDLISNAIEDLFRLSSLPVIYKAIALISEATGEAMYQNSDYIAVRGYTATDGEIVSVNKSSKKQLNLTAAFTSALLQFYENCTD